MLFELDINTNFKIFWQEGREYKVLITEFFTAIGSNEKYEKGWR